MLSTLLAITFLRANAYDHLPSEQREELEDGFVSEAVAVYSPRFDESGAYEAEHFFRLTSPLKQATMMQPTPLLQPRVEVTPTTTSTSQSSSTSLASRLSNDGGAQPDRSVLRQAAEGVSSLSVDWIRGAEAGPLTTTDVGSLLRKSPAALSTAVQRRTPIVNDPRIRSSRVGSLAASGSYWVPARADLDTVLSKIDSRQIEDIIIIPGPYSSVYGPGFRYADFQLLQSPRSEEGSRWLGRSSFDHNSNGNQWLGQQQIGYAAEKWGARASYSHRYGDNYRAGNGSSVDAGYESRELTLALGHDLGDGRSVEFSILHLDQTDVSFPGYVFDIDVLVSDAYEVSYIDENPYLSDRAEFEIWYNRTWFEGDAQNDAKRAQFPLLDRVSYVGTTDVDSLSTGYRRGHTWNQNADYRLTLGHDLRFIKQELNEIASGTSLGLPIPFMNRNSPIPRSYSVNPGVFAEYEEEFLKDYTFRTGTRVDFVQTDVVDDLNKLTDVGLDTIPATYREIIGADETQTDRFLWSLYGTLERQYNEALVGTVSVGYAERPPTLTELYAAQPFLLLLQNGLNNVTGDPRLDNEKLIQADVALDFEGDYLKAGVRGFHGWAMDYITFENTNVLRGPPNGEIQQASLRYVNTDLATLAGGEAFAELFPKAMLSPFVRVRGVDGRDRTRKGNYATTNGSNGSSSQRVAGQTRGFFSGISGSDSEPLPGISPFEMQIGGKLTDPSVDPAWSLILSARVFDNQDRVASSLLESKTAGFTIWDLRGIYQPRGIDGLVVVAGVENFTNKNYREHLDFRSFNGINVFQPGVNFYLGTDWTY
ncbi:TonB-dependent receptor [Novipirellula sp.]|uniref:TonB-dependent receptor n=1 Tax=Novipirellula sp. TaxID=2795430 RepID=UPI0035659045